MLGGGVEDESQVDLQDPQSQITEQTSTPTIQEETSTEEDKEREKYLERTSNDRDGFTLHQGEIIETHTYKTIFNTSWNSDYEGLSSDGSISLPFHKEDLKYIYKGVRCLLKTERFPHTINDETITIDDTDGYLCFITDVTITPTTLELSLCGYEKLLEQENILSFKNQRRSTILEEVIKMAGLVPIIDTTGLSDEVINWSTEQKKDKDDDSSSSTNTSEDSEIVSNDAIEIGNELGNKYKFCAGAGSEDYATMKKKGCGSCWAWSDALYTELTAKGITCRIVQYPTSMSNNHRSVQLQDSNGNWVDYPYKKTSIDKLAGATSGSSNGKVIRGG